MIDFNIDRMHLVGHLDDFFGVTIALHKIRNVLITPASYLFGGRTVTCYYFKMEDRERKSGITHFVYVEDYPKKSIFKTLIAIICLVPSVFAYLFVPPLIDLDIDLKNRWSQFQTRKEKIAHSLNSHFITIKEQIRVATWREDSSMLKRALNQLDSTKLNNFSNYYENLPIDKKAAPRPGRERHIWYSLSDRALNPSTENHIFHEDDFRSHLIDIHNPGQELQE